MKLLLRLLLVTCMVAACLGATAILKPKRAFLVLPAVVSQNDAFNAVVEFRWDEDLPLEIDFIARKEGLVIHGHLNVFSADGRKIPMLYPMTMPLIPTGRKRVVKGELFRAGLYTLEFPQSLAPGEYYAIADFADAYRGEQIVQFVTQKRWFTVRAGKPPDA